MAGQNTGVCKSCLCVREGRHCTDCYPLRIGRCCNLPLTSNSTLSQASSDDLDSHMDVSHCDPVLSPLHSPLRSASSATSITQPDPAATQLGPSNNWSVDLGQPLDRQAMDCLMIEAYGPDATSSASHVRDSVWQSRWRSVTQLSGSHCSLPRGPIGRCYVSILTDEIKFLAQKLFSSERLIIFTSVILQRDKMVKKAGDIKRTIDKRLSMWAREEFDVLIQGAIRCNRSFQLSRKNKTSDHITKVFTRLMFQGKVRAAMRWLSGESRGNLLQHDDIVQQQVGDDSKSLSY